MASHVPALKSLCRLCGCKPESRSLLIPKGTYERDILRFLEIDISVDDAQIHPPSVCDLCRRKLSRSKEVAKKQKKAKLKSPNITLHNFQPHSADDCTVCAPIKWSATFLFEFAQENGFHSWVSAKQNVVAVTVSDSGSSIIKRMVIGASSYQAYVHGKEVKLPHDNPFDAIKAFATVQICVGNHEFQELAEHCRSDGLKGTRGQTVAEVAVLDTADELDGLLTIRHANCQRILMQESNNGKCAVCYMYKANLLQKQSRLKNSAGDVKASTKHSLMSKEQLTAKIAGLQKEKKSMLQKVKTLRTNVQKLMEKENVLLGPQESSQLENILEVSRVELESVIPRDSHCELLWQQQQKALKQKSSKGMRWHPEVIKWAIAIHSKSASAYDVLRNTGFLTLPHPNTLFSYTHFTCPSSGLNIDVLQRFYKDWKMADLLPHQRYVNLLFDEMKIKSGLVFSKSSGKLVGFVDIGTISQEMERFETKCTEGAKDSTNMATHALLFMVRGITTGMKFPAAYYFTNSASGHQIYEMAMQCIKALKLLGLTVLCLTSDGAGSNRKFYEILTNSTPSIKPQHKARNLFEVDEMIYFNSDAPHLLKTLRNNFENSGWNRKTRNLVYKGKAIKWTHLIQLQQWDKALHRDSPGLLLVPKLSYEHLHLSPSLRMRVSLAAQVMSSTVANGLKMMKNSEFESTIHFITMVNKFFDCMNVTTVMEWQKKRNDDLRPYTATNDIRLTWLKDDFLGFLNEWYEEIERQPGLSAKEKEALRLSRPTLAGCHLAVNTFVDITEYLLTKDGVQYILSDKLNQDPIEEFFSKQRGAGGHHDNPSAEQFGHHYMRNIVAGRCVVASRNANVRRLQGDRTPISNEPLPKRPKQLSK